MLSIKKLKQSCFASFVAGRHVAGTTCSSNSGASSYSCRSTCRRHYLLVSFWSIILFLQVDMSPALLARLILEHHLILAGRHVAGTTCSSNSGASSYSCRSTCRRHYLLVSFWSIILFLQVDMSPALLARLILEHHLILAGRHVTGTTCSSHSGASSYSCRSTCRRHYLLV